MNEKVLFYIESHWDECVKQNREDDGTLIGMPYPYTVPAVGHFDEMYYWDTYFTNVGLILSGRVYQAKYNVDNMLYLIARFGHVLNGNRTYYLSRSQPPYLSMMVRDVYETLGDKAWLAGAYRGLANEYTFWQEKRMTPCGLNQYSDNSETDYLEEIAHDYGKRIGYMPDRSLREIGLHYLSVAESGWDINTRFGFEAEQYVQVDLNCLLYRLEKNMAYFSNELGYGESELWEKRAAERKAKMLALMTDENGLLLDYSFVTKTLSDTFSANSYMPLFVGLADDMQARALVKALPRIEAEYGILATEKNTRPGSYQWGTPNGWPCMQQVVFDGLSAYGYTKDARRIAQKYVDLCENCLEKTGKLWEKYNVVEGNVLVTDEYKMPAMMGWTAGVYLAAGRLLSAR